MCDHYYFSFKLTSAAAGDKKDAEEELGITPRSHVWLLSWRGRLFVSLEAWSADEEAALPFSTCSGKGSEVTVCVWSGPLNSNQLLSLLVSPPPILVLLLLLLIIWSYSVFFFFLNVPPNWKIPSSCISFISSHFGSQHVLDGFSKVTGTDCRTLSQATSQSQEHFSNPWTNTST